MKNLLPFFSQFSESAIKNQFAENSKQLEVMSKKAKVTGKYNGFTAEYLEQKSTEYKQKSL